MCPLSPQSTKLSHTNGYTQHPYDIFGALGKLQLHPVPVWPHVRSHNRLTDVHTFWQWRVWINSVDTLQTRIQSDNVKKHTLYMKTNWRFWTHLGRSLPDIRRAHCTPFAVQYRDGMHFNPYPMAFPYGNGMVLHFYQQESSTTKTVHKVINKRLKTYV